MFRDIAVGSSCAFFALVFCTVGRGASVEVIFAGVVTSVGTPLAGEFAVTESVVGSYTYDSTTVDAEPGDANIGRYANAVSAFDATIGGDYTLGLGTANDITVVDDNPYDIYGIDITDPAGATVNGYDVSFLTISLIDSSSTAFTSDALLGAPPALSSFDDEFSFVLYYDGASASESVEFRLTALSVVPEPSTWGLAIVAVVGLGLRRLRNG